MRTANSKSFSLMKVITANDPGPVFWFIVLFALLFITAWNFANGG